MIASAARKRGRPRSLRSNAPGSPILRVPATRSTRFRLHDKTCAWLGPAAVGNQRSAWLRCLHLVTVIMPPGRHDTITKIDDYSPRLRTTECGSSATSIWLRPLQGDDVSTG